MNILFLSVSTGGGHEKAAEAIKEHIDLKYPSSRTLIVDTLKYISPMADRLIVGSYLNAIKNMPNVYGKLYKISEYDTNITDITKTISRMLSGRLLEFINEFNPTAIVCTHTITLQMVSHLKKKNRLYCPLMGIITDFTNHLFWKLGNIDAYIVGNEFIKKKMIDMGTSSDTIHTFGIPVSRDFLVNKSRKALLDEFKLDNSVTALIMGGSLGFGEMRAAFQLLLESKKVQQIIAITGRNSKLKEQLESCCSDNGKKIRILGYTNRVADYMEIADFIITKPGGLTISEALIKKLPIFIMSPIPGQEEKNAQFLINSGAAVRIMPDDIIDEILHQTVENPLRLRHMKEMSGFLAKPHAGEDIMHLLEKLIIYSNIQNTVEI